VIKNKNRIIFATKLKRGLAEVSLGEIKYQRRNTKRIKTTKLKMDKERKPPLVSVKEIPFTFLPLIMPSKINLPSNLHFETSEKAILRGWEPFRVNPLRMNPAYAGLRC
jgi:hypothetical protein